MATKKLATRHLIGRVAECLIEAYGVISSGGLLDGFRPGVDMDHKDLIFDEVGGYRNVYAQVKCATQLINNCVRCHVQVGSKPIPADPSFVYIFCWLDLKAMDLIRIWVVPSPDFNRLAYRSFSARSRFALAFSAKAAGDPKWDKFLVDKHSLGPRLLEIALAAPRRKTSNRLNLGTTLAIRARLDAERKAA